MTICHVVLLITDQPIDQQTLQRLADKHGASHLVNQKLEITEIDQGETLAADGLPMFETVANAIEHSRFAGLSIESEVRIDAQGRSPLAVILEWLLNLTSHKFYVSHEERMKKEKKG